MMGSAAFRAILLSEKFKGFSEFKKEKIYEASFIFLFSNDF
jgi:hypothetical protein